MSDEVNLRKIIDSDKWLTQRHNQAAFGLVNHIIAMGPNVKGIEIGVNLGINSYMLLEQCPNIIELVGVDHFAAYQDWQSFITQETQDKNFEVFSENLKILGPRYKFIKASSSNAAPLIPDLEYDFVFIDADHSMRAVLQDLDNYWPKLKPNGIIAGHDSNLFGVNFAVTSWAKHKGFSPDTIQVIENNAWWWRKL